MKNLNGWKVFIFFLSMLPGFSGFCWENHAQITWAAIGSDEDWGKKPPVTGSSIESFLEATRDQLGEILEQEENWARKEVKDYPSRPDALRFKTTESGYLKDRFFHAIRVNPSIFTPLYLKRIEGDVSPDSRGVIPVSKVDLLGMDRPKTQGPYRMIKEGEKISPVLVLAAASDEPDLGMDIGLFEDNATPFGKIYGWGVQSFGNAKIKFASQAPFHMGFYHEPEIILSAAPFLKKTFPEVRIHLFQTLARFAFSVGQSYWGYRFAGWGLHYVQDLTQPYHVQPLPGLSVPALIGLETLAFFGYSKPKQDWIQLVSNRHLALENFQMFGLAEALKSHQEQDSILRKIWSGVRDLEFGAFLASTPRTKLTQFPYDSGVKIDKILVQSVPKSIVKDPSFVFLPAETETNLYEELKKSGSKEDFLLLKDHVANLTEWTGAATRSFLKTCF